MDRVGVLEQFSKTEEAFRIGDVLSLRTALRYFIFFKVVLVTFTSL